MKLPSPPLPIMPNYRVNQIKEIPLLTLAPCCSRRSPRCTRILPCWELQGLEHPGSALPNLKKFAVR